MVAAARAAGRGVAGEQLALEVAQGDAQLELGAEGRELGRERGRLGGAGDEAGDRRFRAATGANPAVWRNQNSTGPTYTRRRAPIAEQPPFVRRMVEEAKELLKQNVTIKQIHEQFNVGRKMFESFFTEAEGLTPTAWRQRYRRKYGLEVVGPSKMVVFRLREYELLVRRAREADMPPNTYARAVLRAHLQDVSAPLVLRDDSDDEEDNDA